MKTANELIDEIAKDPSCDKFFDRDPAKLADADIREVVLKLRARREAFKVKEQTGFKQSDDDRIDMGDVWGEGANVDQE